MKKLYRLTGSAAGVVVLLGCLSSVAHAEVTLDNVIGIGYQNGFSDVSDFHETLGYDVNTLSYFGFSYRLAAKFENSVRMDFGLGPVMFMTGDASYSDIPFNATVGYTFLEKETFRPYVRGGFSYHINSGDYVDSDAGFGFLAALGCEIGDDDGVSFFAEVAYDTAEATLKGSTWVHPEVVEEDVTVNGLLLTVGIVF